MILFRVLCELAMTVTVILAFFVYFYEKLNLLGLIFMGNGLLVTSWLLWVGFIPLVLGWCFCGNWRWVYVFSFSLIIRCCWLWLFVVYSFCCFRWGVRLSCFIFFWLWRCVCWVNHWIWCFWLWMNFGWFRHLSHCWGVIFQGSGICRVESCRGVGVSRELIRIVIIFRERWRCESGWFYFLQQVLQVIFFFPNLCCFRVQDLRVVIICRDPWLILDRWQTFWFFWLMLFFVFVLIFIIIWCF